MDAVGELVDIVRILAFFPSGQTPQIVFHGVERRAEIAVDDAVERIG